MFFSSFFCFYFYIQKTSQLPDECESVSYRLAVSYSQFSRHDFLSFSAISEQIWNLPSRTWSNELERTRRAQSCFVQFVEIAVEALAVLIELFRRAWGTRYAPQSMWDLFCLFTRRIQQPAKVGTEIGKAWTPNDLVRRIQVSM